MANPKIGYYDHLTGEQIIREMNTQELKEWEDSKKPSIPIPLVIEQSTPMVTDADKS
jgi:hypothetical protein